MICILSNDFLKCMLGGSLDFCVMIFVFGEMGVCLIFIFISDIPVLFIFLMLASLALLRICAFCHARDEDIQNSGWRLGWIAMGVFAIFVLFDFLYFLAMITSVFAWSPNLGWGEFPLETLVIVSVQLFVIICVQLLCLGWYSCKADTQFMFSPSLKSFNGQVLSGED